MKGVDDAVADEAPVRLFVMGTGDGHRTTEGRLSHGGYWYSGEECPLATTECARFYRAETGSGASIGEW